MAGSQDANVQLIQMYTRCGWSHKELARRINLRAQVRGFHLRIDTIRVRSWLAGQHPQSPIPELLSELFSEQLGYLVTPADIGFIATNEHIIGLQYSESITATIAAVAELGKYDTRRCGFLRYGTFHINAGIAPSRDWLLAVLDATEPRPSGRIDEQQVSAIQATFAAFQEADALHGGGHARTALAEYLTNWVLPLLRNADPDSEVGAALFATAAAQTHLLGWMAMDDNRPALAQRYLIQALRLAQASGDTALGAAALADMSDQARMLGHPHEALQLAMTGRHGLARVFSPAYVADLWASQARAHAALGDTAAAVRAVLESRHAFERIASDADRDRSRDRSRDQDRDRDQGRDRFIDAAYLCSRWADTFADLGRPEEAARFARRSISAAAGRNRARREALSQATLARAGLAERDLDIALCAAYRAVELSSTVQSSRCIAAVRDLRTRISPFRTVIAAQEFDEHARTILS